MSVSPVKGAAAASAVDSNVRVAVVPTAKIRRPSDRAAVIEMMGLIELELRRLGLRSNSSKRSIRSRNESQLVHGLHVNNGVSIPKPYRKTVRAAVHQAARDGCSKKRFRQLMGQVNYIAQLHRREARKLGATLRSARIVDAQVRGESVPKEAA